MKGFHRARTALLLTLGLVIYAASLPSLETGAKEVNPGDSIFVQEFRTGTPTVFRASFGSAGKFRFITPIAPNPPDQNADFDADLLPYLTVKICKINGAECSYLKTFTSTTSPDRIRIENKQGRFFIVNWTTDASFDNTPIYRVSVEVPGETLGTVDIPPSAYRQWGRTWPIKFIVEKDPALWSRLLVASGMTIWQVADELRTRFGFCNDELRDLLAIAFPDASDDQVAEVVSGVCQNVELFPTTKIADKATRDALGLYDMPSGRMVFIGDTTLLRDLRVNDVLVGRESAAAPYGYMRKVRSISKSKSVYTLETVQAKFTEAIKVGTLQVSGGLEPADASSLSGNKLASANTKLVGGTIDIGQLIPFERHIDVVIDLNGGDDEIGGTGTIRVVGDIEIKAGYNIGAGIELCTTPPFACADRVEAWMGYIHKSNLRVTGTFDGHVRKEFAYPIPMAPIFFMVGPIPVWLVPEINVIVGFDGTAHVNFEFATEAQSTVKPYIKWTDDQGWKDLTTFAPLSNTFFDARFDGNARLEGYAKLDAALLLYGAIGPAMDGSLGIVGEAQTGQTPFWKISGHVKAGIGLRSAFTELFDLDVHEDFLDETFTIKEAENLAPEFFNQRFDTIPVNVGEEVYLGPRTPGAMQGYYEVRDPEGGAVNISLRSSVEGPLPDNTQTHIFNTAVPRTITVTATDTSGKSSTFDLHLDVRNSLAEITISGPDTIPATVQYFATAMAHDLEDGYLQCASVNWFVVAPDTVTRYNMGSTCGAEVIFRGQGPRQLTVTATDQNGGVGTKTKWVDVTQAPANPPPSYDITSVSVQAHRGPQSSDCPDGFYCEVDNGDFINNGEALGGEYFAPLFMRLTASDPQGELVSVRWFCETASYSIEATSLGVAGNGYYTCDPVYTDTQDLFIRALISDGVNPPVEVRARTLRYLHRTTH